MHSSEEKQTNTWIHLRGEFLPLTLRWTPLLTHTSGPHQPLQKYSPASCSCSPTISRLISLLVGSLVQLMRLLFTGSTLDKSSPPLSRLWETVSRGSSWSERSRYQMMSELDVMLQLRETFWPGGTTRGEPAGAGEEDDRWRPAAPEAKWIVLMDICSTNSYTVYK